MNITLSEKDVKLVHPGTENAVPQHESLAWQVRASDKTIAPKYGVNVLRANGRVRHQ